MNNEILISVNKLKKSFDTRHINLASIIRRDKIQKVYAIDNVSFELKKGEILGLIGESGCGKSTTARMLLKMIEPDQGEIIFKQQNITNLNKFEMQNYRKKAQIVFQDPYEYLNPRLNVLDIISEPLIINKMVKTQNERIEYVKAVLSLTGLTPTDSYLYRFSHELSGGQKQRVAIARALVMKPELLVADEPTSMLDVSVRAGILNLLLELKKEYGLSIVFITHDIATAGYMCDRIAVMYKGRIVEIGPKEKIIYNPNHPYTKALVNVAGDLQTFILRKDDFIKDGEVNNYIASKYCSFVDRCVLCDDNCRGEQEYTMIEVEEEHYTACCKCSGNTNR